MSGTEIYWGMPGQPFGMPGQPVGEKIQIMQMSFPGHEIEWYKCIPYHKSTKELLQQGFDEDFPNVRLMGVTTTLDYFSYENFAALHQENEDNKINADRFKEMFQEVYKECEDLKEKNDKKEEENESLKRLVKKVLEDFERGYADSNLVPVPAAAASVEEISLEERVSPEDGNFSRDHAPTISTSPTPHMAPHRSGDRVVEQQTSSFSQQDGGVGGGRPAMSPLMISLLKMKNMALLGFRDMKNTENTQQPNIIRERPLDTNTKTEENKVTSLTTSYTTPTGSQTSAAHGGGTPSHTDGLSHDDDNDDDNDDDDDEGMRHKQPNILSSPLLPEEEQNGNKRGSVQECMRTQQPQQQQQQFSAHEGTQQRPDAHPCVTPPMTPCAQKEN